MHPTLQLLERHHEEISNDEVHWFDAPEKPSQLLDNHKVYALNASNYNNADKSDSRWPTTHLNILFYPKARERLIWWLEHLHHEIQVDQRIWVVGENGGGIKSLPKRVVDTFECVKLDSARHCALFELTKKDYKNTTNHWKETELAGQKNFSLPGVFSAGRIDKGTQILLDHLPAIKGDLLEFGCGSGVLTTALLQQNENNKVTAFDIDLLAVRSCERTLKENGLDDRASIYWSDNIEDLPKNKYQAIVTNPPFHKGIKTEYGATESFFSKAKDLLKPRGKLIWVANDFLNYENALQRNFHSIKVLAHKNGFKVFVANL